MKLELEVLASTSIKRKKPWPRLAWIGEAQESIFLVDAHRLSVLYVPSGKTRRRVPKLQPLLEDVTALNHSENGQFMVGLLRSGDAFLWHKDTDMLKYVQGLPELAQSLPNVSNNANRPCLPMESPAPCVYIADDGSKMAVVVNRTRLYVWEQDADQVLFAARSADVKGAWTEVKPSRAVSIPDPSARETAVSAVFFINDVLGLCCLCSLVFTLESSVCVTTAVMRWYEPHHLLTYSKPTFTVEWNDMRYPLADLTPGGGPVRAAGAYVTRASHDGQLLAIAVNQKNSNLNRMMFVSPLSDTVVVSDLRGMGAKIPVTRAYSSYWVTDLAWTADDLFTIVMTKQGSIAMVTRLGEPLLLRTFGCSLDMGPRYYLPLHPLISIKPVVKEEAHGPHEDAMDLEAQAAADRDPMRQRFSLSCHPRLPIFLCSDGYMVTAIQLPADLTCLSLMKGFVMESNHHLHRLRDQQKLSFSLYDSMRRQGRVTKKLSLSNGVVGGRRMVRHVRHARSAPYRFEEPEEDALNHSLGEDDDEYGRLGAQLSMMTELPTGNMQSGKLFFGDLETLNTSADLEASTLEENLGVVQLVESTQKALLLAWSLGASHCGAWTEEHENVATNIAHNLVRLFAMLIHTSDQLLAAQESSEAAGKNLGLERVLRLVTSLLQLLRLDIAHQHLMVCGIRFAQSTVHLLLNDPQLLKLEPRLTTLLVSFKLLHFVEQAYSGIYTSIPAMAFINGLQNGLHQEFMDVYEPPTLCQYQAGTHSTENDVKPRYEMSGMPPDQRKLIRPLPEQQDELTGLPPQRSEIVKRLGPAWRLLYKHTIGLFKTINNKKVKAKVRRTVHGLMVTLQVKLTTIGHGNVLVPAKKRKVQPGSRLSIEGCSIPALKAWMYQLNMPKDTGMDADGRLLLSTLYSLLLQDELRAVIELTELLLRQPDVRSAAATCRQEQTKKWAMLALLQQDTGSSTPPQYIKNAAVRALVRSVARFMAAYFSNKTLFVFPPHAPRIMPPLHRAYTVKHRVIPLYHESVANVVRQDGLGAVWTAERAADYLLISGLLSEAAWFTDALGDWKTAFTLSVAQSEHQRALPHLYMTHKRKLEMPEAIQPDTVLQTRLAHSFGLKTNSKAGLLVDEETDLPALRRVLADLMLAAVLSRVDLVPWLLEGLVDRLRTVTARFSAVVSPGLYLPAPPVYCPQPASTSQAQLSDDDAHEVTLRQEASSLIQLMFLVLDGANCTLPTARWYARKVAEANTKGGKFKPVDVTTSKGPDVSVLQASFLQEDPGFSGREDDPSVRRILAAYRDMCSVVWLFYVRDKLSLGLRKKLQLVERKMKKSPVPPEAWLKHCRETLHWAASLVPFAHFLQAENDIFGITLSLIVELPPDEHACHLLCQFFHDAESLDPELQDKLGSVLKDWQGVFINPPPGTPRADPGTSLREGTAKSPRGTSLSFYFHKQAQRMERHFRRKAKVFGEYEVFVFDDEMEEENHEAHPTQSNEIFVGSRPFESDDTYYEFLDVFYSVSFHKSLDAEEKEATTPLPLLSASSGAFRQKELTSIAHRAVTSLQQKQQMTPAPTSPRRTVTSDASPSWKSNVMAPPRSRLPSSPRAKVGLFRSRSFSELSNKRSQLPPSSPLAAHKKASSHQDLSMISADEEDFLEVHAARPRPSPAVGGGSAGTSPRSGSRYAASRQLSGSDTLLTSDGVVPKMTLARRCMFRRSSSVSDVDDARKERRQTQSRVGSAGTARLPAEDPLLNPIIPPAQLKRIEFGESFSELEQLLEWLTRWAGRNHTLTRAEHQAAVSPGPQLSDSQLSLSTSHLASPLKTFELENSLKVAPAVQVEKVKPGPAMRIKVNPRMVVYSLWLVENQYYTLASKPAPTATPPPPPPEENKTIPSSRPPSAPPARSTGPDTAQEPIEAAPTPGQSEPDVGASGRDASVSPRVRRRQRKGLEECTPQHLDDEQLDLEESYLQQIVSAESNESLSDGFIPQPKRKKMGILKKKKKKKEKEVVATVVEPVAEVPTSETLLRRLSFKVSERGQAESTVPSQNVSQVSDSTLNVSSLNDEELPDTMRQTLTRLNTTTKKPGVKSSVRAADMGPAYTEKPRADDIVTDAADARLLDQMEDPGAEKRLDLRHLETAQGTDQPDDLRSMVRQELRKIVEAQHRGILAMLGALGEDEEDAPLGASTPHDRPGRRQRRQPTRKKTPAPSRQHADHRQDQHVLNVTQDTSLLDPSSLTEVDVSPLPSDDGSLKSLDAPLTVSDLFRSKTWSPGAKFESREVGNNVRGALRELKTLENSQTPNHVHFDLQNQSRPHHGNTSVPPSGKENEQCGANVAGQRGHGRGQPGPQPGHLQQDQQVFMTHPNQSLPPGPYMNDLPDTGQPFARVFNMLKRMNHDIASQQTGSMARGAGGPANVGPRPPLLHVPGPAPAVRFPPIPGTMASASLPHEVPSGGPARMPLLHLYTPHHTDEVPVRDLTGNLPPTARQAPPAAPFRMPLLRMMAPPSQPRVFQHIEDERGELALVPAEEVLAYENRRQEERRRKLEQRRAQMEALGLSGPHVQAMLDKVERRDQRQTERRKQRRQKAGDDDAVKTSRENLSSTIQLNRHAPEAEDLSSHQALLQTSSRHVQVDGPEMSTQEVQVSYTPTPREQTTQGVQYPTPRTGSLDHDHDGESEEEVEEDLDQLHHGYALTPGLFDEYLMKDGEMGTAEDNAARMQYRATSGIRRRKLKEVGTETEGPGWTDTGTITCRDQGTDPVAEALESYVKAQKNLKAGGFVAPDVFMGLRFSDGGQTAAPSGSEGGAPGRAFINVVDLDEEALADIVTSLPERDESLSRGTAQPASPQKERAKRQQKDRPAGGRHVRVETTPEELEELEEETTGPDRVTSRVLSSRRSDGKKVAASGAASYRARAHNKDGLRDRLEDMDIQFEAIEAMSRNIEEDYKNARLMIHTIEQIGEAIQPSPDIPYEDSRDDDEFTPRTRPPHSGREAYTGMVKKEAQRARDHVSDTHSQVGLSADLEDVPDDESHAEPGPQVATAEASGLDMTGLSGVSDIIGEVIASGRVDTAGLGLSDRQARQLINKASAREGMTVSDLQKNEAQRKAQEENERRRAEKEREQLKAWMDQKRRERFGDFKKRQQELRERERQPFKPSDESGQMSTLTFKEFEEWETNRVASKKEKEMSHTEKRLMEASALMGDILTDRPILPQEPSPRLPVRKPTQSPQQRAASASRREASASPARRGASRSPARGQVAARTRPDNTKQRAYDQRRVQDSRDYDQQLSRHADNQVALGDRAGHGRTFSGPKDAGTHSGLLNTQTGTSSAGLRAYTRHLEDVQDSFEPDSEVKENEPPADESAEAPLPVYKPKAFTEKVRLQRPEVTRDSRPRQKPKPYVQRLSETSQISSTPRSATTADRRAQERLYGTKRIPGTQTVRAGPRTVKTYQERVREMKQERAAQRGPINRYSGPIPAMGGATVTKPMSRPMKRMTKPKKKPLTYAQQLKALQPPKEMYRTGTGESMGSLTQSRGRARRGPPHKPVTYQEQLQKLQPPKELFRTPPGGTFQYQQDGPVMSQRPYRTPPQHALRRSGPYPSPYQAAEEEDVEERASVMSPWGMEDDVRRLLYDDATSSYVAASRTGTDLDLSELQDLADLDDRFYTDLVDVQEIADVASISDGSIMSFIDWDQVNDLIADAY